MEQNDNSILDSEEQNKDDDKEGQKVLRYVFLPLFILTLPTFFYLSYRTYYLYTFCILITLLAFGAIKKVGFNFSKIKKLEILYYVIFILTLYFKFLADLVLAFLLYTFLFVSIISFINIDVKKIITKAVNMIFIISVVISLILDYNDLIKLYYKLFSNSRTVFH